MNAIGKMLDALTVWYVRRRIRGEPLRSTAPQFGNRIVAVLRTEVDSRAGELARLETEQAARETAAAERALRAHAMEQFQQDSCPADRARLQ